MEDTLRGNIINYFNQLLEVLILVLMEDTLRGLDKSVRGFVGVLILVLMEDTLRGCKG